MHNRPPSHGFSLIELMIAVAILGILATIAYPLYIDKVRESRRVEGKSLVMQAANRQEQLYSAAGNQYRASMSDLGLPTLTENGYYKVGVTTPDKDKQHYLITATAQGDQTNDGCVTYTLDDRGARHAYASKDATGTDIAGRCW